METLRRGSQGTGVARLQEMLRKRGYPVKPDGIFGRQTYLAVCMFQKENGLKPDGIAGKDTWSALGVPGGNHEPAGEGDPSTVAGNAAHLRQETPARSTPASLPGEPERPDYAAIATLLDVEEAAVRAVCEIESGGRSGFLPDGRPIILFEGHIFWRELKKRGIDPEKYSEAYSDVLFPKWDKSKYKGGAAEHNRLERAMALNEEAALCSASWGMFQIMGFNYKLCGYASVHEYVQAIKSDAGNHLLSFARFLKNTGIDQPLRKLDWAGFAVKYNGPGYRQNQYDVKLQQAYMKYKK